MSAQDFAQRHDILEGVRQDPRFTRGGLIAVLSGFLKKNRQLSRERAGYRQKTPFPTFENEPEQANEEP